MSGPYAKSIKRSAMVMIIVAAAAFTQANSYAADAASDDRQLDLYRPEAGQEREERNEDLYRPDASQQRQERMEDLYKPDPAQ